MLSCILAQEARPRHRENVACSHLQIGMTVNQILHLAFITDPANASQDLIDAVLYLGAGGETATQGECRLLPPSDRHDRQPDPASGFHYGSSECQPGFDRCCLVSWRRRRDRDTGRMSPAPTFRSA